MLLRGKEAPSPPLDPVSAGLGCLHGPRQPVTAEQRGQEPVFWTVTHLSLWFSAMGLRKPAQPSVVLGGITTKTYCQKASDGWAGPGTGKWGRVKRNM